MATLTAELNPDEYYYSLLTDMVSTSFCTGLDPFTTGYLARLSGFPDGMIEQAIDYVTAVHQYPEVRLQDDAMDWPG